MATLQELTDLQNEVAAATDISEAQRKFYLDQIKTQLASNAPATVINPPPGMAPTGATIEGINYRPLPDVELSDRERALKQADLIASRYQIPYIETPAKGEIAPVIENGRVAKAGIPAIPAQIGYRRGSTADFMSGSNPYETYTDSQIPDLPAAGAILGAQGQIPAPPSRPAMYFGEGIPALPVSQDDYMNVMDLSSRAAGVRVPMTTPTGQATPVPPVLPTATPRMVAGTPVPVPTATPMIANSDPFGGVPVLGDPSIVGDPAFLAADRKKPVTQEVVQMAVQTLGTKDKDKITDYLAGQGFYFR